MKRLETWILKYSPRFIVTLTCLAVLLIGVAAYILTQYQPKTACQRDPQGRECQQLRADGAQAQTKRVACIPFRQVGYVCPAPKLVDRGSGKPALPAKTGGSDGGTQSSSPGTGAVSGGGDEPSGGGDPGGAGGGDGDPLPDPPPSPGPGPAPGPSPEPEPEPTPADPGSVLGSGLDLPLIEECDTLIVKGVCQ